MQQQQDDAAPARSAPAPCCSFRPGVDADILGCGCRLQKIYHLLNPMYKVKDFLTSEFLDWFMEIFPQTTAMILNLSDEELKSEAVKVNNIVDILCSLYRLTSHSDSPEAVDKFRLDLALKGLRSPYLERRLTGLGDINEFVEVTCCIPVYQLCAVAFVPLHRLGLLSSVLCVQVVVVVLLCVFDFL